MLLEAEGRSVVHLPLNHWLGIKAYASPSALVNQQLALTGDLQTPKCLCSKSLESILTDIGVFPQSLHSTPTAAAVGSSLVVHASVHAHSHSLTSGMGPGLSVPQQSHAALQLVFLLWHPSWSLPHPQHQLAALGGQQLLYLHHSAYPGGQGLSVLSVHCPAMLTDLPGDLRFGTSHVAAAVLSTTVVLQPLPAWSDVVADDSYEAGMCLIQDKPFTNETVGLLPSGSEATSSGCFFTYPVLC